MNAVCHRPSLCHLSVTFVHPTQAIEIFGNVVMPFGTLTFRLKFYGDRPWGTPPLLVKRKRGSQNIAILDLSEAISQKRCKIGGELLLITNRKSHMGFRLVPNSVTLDYLERRNRPNCSVFHRIKKILGRIM